MKWYVHHAEYGEDVYIPAVVGWKADDLSPLYVSIFMESLLEFVLS